jgi:rhamnose transport system ATP-binding protein
VDGVSFEVHAGEVLGLGGMVGAGRTEIARALFGLDRVTSGSIELDGTPVAFGRPDEAIAAGIGLVPENRKADGLFFNFEGPRNITTSKWSRVMRGLVFDLSRERAVGRSFVDMLKITPTAMDTTVRFLSGGNQQKVVIARWLHAEAKVLILDEPTQGIDVGAKLDVYGVINDLAAQGVAIILISSDYPELIAMSDRIAVIREGAVAAVMPAEEMTEHRLIAIASGAAPASRPAPATGGPPHDAAAVELDLPGSLRGADPGRGLREPHHGPLPAAAEPVERHAPGEQRGPRGDRRHAGDPRRRHRPEPRLRARALQLHAGDPGEELGLAGRGGHPRHAVAGRAPGAVQRRAERVRAHPGLRRDLATLTIYRGLAFLITGGTPIFSISPKLRPIFYGSFLGVPLPLYYVVAAFVLTALFLRYTVPGRAIYAVGGNESAARFTGIKVNRTRLLTFVIAGLMAAAAGVLTTARLDSGSPNYGVALELQAIAAAVIGGASLAGGYGNIIATLFGALIVAVVQNGLNLNAVPASWQQITLGTIILMAVGLDMWRKDLGDALRRLFRRPGQKGSG